MVELRWLVAERHYTTWDDRWGEDDLTWITVPTVVEIANK